MRISIEPRNMGDYILYFVNEHIINIGGCYSMHLYGVHPFVKINNTIDYIEVNKISISYTVCRERNKFKQATSVNNCVNSFGVSMNK